MLSESRCRRESHSHLSQQSVHIDIRPIGDREDNTRPEPHNAPIPAEARTGVAALWGPRPRWPEAIRDAPLPSAAQTWPDGSCAGGEYGRIRPHESPTKKLRMLHCRNKFISDLVQLQSANLITPVHMP